MDGAELELAGGQRTGDRSSLRPRIGEVELACDAPLEEVEMRLEDDAGLHDMQVMDRLGIHPSENLGQKVGLFLVVSFEANFVTRNDNRLEQRLGLRGLDHFSAGEARPQIQATPPFRLLPLPLHKLHPPVFVRNALSQIVPHERPVREASVKLNPFLVTHWVK